MDPDNAVDVDEIDLTRKRAASFLRDRPPVKYFGKPKIIPAAAVQHQKSKAGPSQNPKASLAAVKKPKKTRSSSAAGGRKKTKDDGPFVPIRQYYHSISYIKFKQSDWENDVDSDDEVDHSWRIKVEDSLLHDFTDIPEAEKDFMILWNAFIRSDAIIRSKSIPQKCLNFIESHAVKLREAGLEEQLPWHLTNLWDEGLISSHHLSGCLDRFHDLLAGKIAHY